MRRIAKFFLIFIVSLFVCQSVFAADYRILVIPDNLSSKPCLDAFIYEESAEFFANQIVNKLNQSGSIEAPSISEVREKLSKNPRLYSATRDSLLRFKKGYNINYLNARKLGIMFNTNKVLLITTSADAQNYFMRRTFWDFLNIPGASVIDPAIKLSTYAVLIDTNKDTNLWEDTFYKTISSCENRMVANSLAPQTEQLEKVRDYSKMLGPQIAHSVQATVVPATMLTRANVINYGPKDFDNIFTKKFRWYKHGAGEITRETNEKYTDYRQSQRDRGIEPLPDKFRRWKIEHKEKKAAQKIERARLREEKAKLKLEEEHNKHIQEINRNTNTPKVNKENVIEIKDTEQNIKPAVKTKETEPKIINITKEELIEPKTIEPIQEPKLKYYQPKVRTIPEAKNTTINDI